MNRLFALAGLLLVCFARTLFAVDATGATAGAWTYDVPAARHLADTTDRPLLVMFGNSSGKCAWCNKFEKEINNTEEWKIYATEQQLAMAYINFNGPNWDEDYYLSVCTSNQTAITGFPAFVLYKSDGTNVLTSFSYNSSNLTFTAEAFITKIDDALESGNYLLDGQDIWDHGDDTAVGATILEFQTYNQKQYHLLNDPENTPADTEDWFKFLCVSGRKYKLQIPQYDYNITFTSTITNTLTYTNVASDTWLPTGSSSNGLAATASTNWLTLASNVVVVTESTNWFDFPDYFWLTNGLPSVVQTATNIVVQSSVTNYLPVATNYATKAYTNLPHGSEQAVTNGTPPDVVVPTFTLLDPTRQTPLTVDAGPLGYTNSLPLTALTNGCVFTPSSALNDMYCFIRVSQTLTNDVGTFGAEVSQPPVTNLVIYTTVTNTATKTVTEQIVSNAWRVVSVTPTNIYDYGYGYERPSLIVTTNLVCLTERRTITTTAYAGWSHVTTNAYETVTTNYVNYTYGGTSYKLNYRLWEPGEIVFSPTNVSSSETASTVKLTVTRRNGSAGSAKISYRLADDTALAGQDYKATEGELFWADGQTGSTNITVELIQDLRPTWEGDERFLASIQKHPDAPWFQAAVGSASNAVVTLKESAAKAAGKLVFCGFGDDDAPFANPSKPAVTVAENGALTLWVTRSGGSNGAARVTVSTVSGTAVAGTDFQPDTVPLTWADGECDPLPVTTIAPVNRDPYNRDATFTVRLSSASGAALGSPATVTVTVRDKAVAYSLSDTASAAAAAGAVFKATSPLWFWADAGRTTLRSEPLAQGGKAVLQLTVTGPGRLSFGWAMNDWSSPDSLACSGGVVSNKTLQADSGVCEVLVKPGKQTVTWTYTKATAADAEAYASLTDLVWEPLPKAVLDAPANGARVNPDTLSWIEPAGTSCALGGDFASGVGSLSLTRNAVAVSPKGLVLSNVTESVTFDELWNGAAPSYNTAYKWRVDTAFAGADGTLVNTGDTWSFTAVNASDDTGFPPAGTSGTAGYYEALQGVACDFGDITPVADGRTYALVGGTLPAGLKLTATTGRIWGVPTKAGTWTVTLQATVSVGGVRTPLNSATFAITVYPLGTFAGTYTGWTTTDREDLPFSGSGSATVSAAGDLTAKFILAGTTYSFSKKGFDGTDSPSAPALVTNGVCFGAAVTATNGKFTNRLERLTANASGGLTAELTLYTLVKNSTGTMTATAGVHAVELFKNTWSDAYMKGLLGAFAGYYTVSLPVTAARNEAATPLGSGYVTMTVGSGGSVKLSGVLADGNMWSGSTTLLYLDSVDTNDTATAGKAAHVYLCAAPSSYSGKGGFCGLVRITAGESLYGNVVDASNGSGTLQWWNFTPTSVCGATGTVATAESGFANAAGAAGGFYDTVMNLQTYYLNKTLTFEDAVLEASPDTPTADRLPADYDGWNGSSGYELLSEDGMLPYGTALRVGAQSLAAVAKSVVSNDTDLASNSLLDCIDLVESENVAGLTLSLTRATGLLSGSFDLVYERENTDGAFVRRTRKVSFKGVHTPVRPRDPGDDPSAGVQGAGFYLIPEADAYIDATGRNVSYSFNWSYAFELFSAE